MPDALVSIWATDGKQAGTPPATAITAVTDSSGSFRFASLRPGPYRLVAWEENDPAAALDSRFCDLFRTVATQVELGLNDKKTADLSPVPAAGVTAAMRALP